MALCERIFAVAGVVAVAAVTAWWWRGRASSPAPTPPAVARGDAPAAHDHDHGHAAPAAAAPRAVVPMAAAAPEAPFDHAAERAEFNRLKAEGARAALAGIVLNRDFPFWTRPLNDSNRWQPPTPHHQKEEDRHAPGRVLELWPEKRMFVTGEPVVVHARILDGGVAIAAPRLEAFTESPPRLGRPTLALELRDDGGGGDAIAGDLIYSAQVPVERAPAGERAGTWGYRVRAHFSAEPLETTNQFVVWPGAAALAGRYRDVIDDGSLVVHCAVRASETVEIQVRGELRGPGGEEIAFAWANATIPEGTTEVALRFWGKAIHDRGVDGPYKLTNVVLGYPRQRLVGPEAVAVAHTTKRYAASQFRSDGYNAGDPMFQSQIEEYEEQLAKAERGELEPGPAP